MKIELITGTSTMKEYFSSDIAYFSKWDKSFGKTFRFHPWQRKVSKLDLTKFFAELCRRKKIKWYFRNKP